MSPSIVLIVGALLIYLGGSGKLDVIWRGLTGRIQTRK